MVKCRICGSDAVPDGWQVCAPCGEMLAGDHREQIEIEELLDREAQEEIE